MDDYMGKPLAPAFSSRLRRTIICVILVAAALFAFGTAQLLAVHARESATATARLVAAALVPGPNGDLSSTVAQLQARFPGLLAVGTLNVEGGIAAVYPDRLAHHDLILDALRTRSLDDARSTPVALRLPSPAHGDTVDAQAVILPLNGSHSPLAQQAVIVLRHDRHQLGWAEATASFLLLALAMGCVSHRSMYRWFEREVAGPLRAMAYSIVDEHPEADHRAAVDAAGWRETALIARHFEELVWRTAQSAAHAEKVKQDAKRRLRERQQGFDRLLQRARDRATVDPLTGLRNRAFLEDKLEPLLADRSAGAADAALIMLDVDNFKQYNDAHGHQVGDALLRFLGAVLKGAVRADDFAFRYGGDEFLLLLRGAGRQQATALAERIVKLFAQYADRLGKSCGLSISAGVACQAVHNCATGHELLDLADRALYAAKRAGKNRVGVQPALRKPASSNPAVA